MHKEINSHTVIPHCILKRFEGAGHNLYYYDRDKKWYGSSLPISPITAKKFNTWPGFFSVEMESTLSRSIEHPIAEAIQFLRRSLVSCESLDVPQEHQEAIRLYLLALLSRPVSFSERIRNRSVFLQFTEIEDEKKQQAIHDLSTSYGIEAGIEKKLFDPAHFIYILNHSSVPFFYLVLATSA